MDKTELLAAINTHHTDHIALLQSFIQAASPNPPGDTTKAAEVIIDYLKNRGVDTNIISPKANMPNITSHFRGQKGNGPHVVMNGHMDVFPVGDGADWTHGPWSGHDDGTFIYGRGGVDMKAGTLALVIAYSYLYERKAELKGSLALTAVSDEETGGVWGSRWLLDHDSSKALWRGDCMINAEPSGLESVRFGEKGTLRLTFTVRTIGAHGAYLHLSEGANAIAVRLFTELRSVEKLTLDPKILPPGVYDQLQKKEVRDIIDKIMGNGAAENMMRPTLNIGTWHGGLKVNMIPDQCVVEADIRLPIGLTTERVLEHVKKIVEKYPEVALAVQEAASNPPNASTTDHPMLRAMITNAESVTGMRPISIPSLGATDCKFWRYLGIPTYEYGPSPVSMASRDEHVSKQEFLSLIKVHASTVWDYLGGKS